MLKSPHIEVNAIEGFGLNNLPFGVFSWPDTQEKCIGVAIGDSILDMTRLEAKGLLQLHQHPIFDQGTLNAFAALGTSTRKDARAQIISLLTDADSPLKELDAHVFCSQERAHMHYPFETRGYTDFYSSENHARNVGSLFRDPENALNRNWKYLPVAYHGRTSSLVTTGVTFPRPKGQILEPGTDTPTYGSCKKLDFEIEMGFFIGTENNIFEAIPINNARDAIFGLTIVNDWSARDIQAFEYVPLGPFLGKNFLTAVSPWVVTPEALEPFSIPMKKEDHEVVKYLQQPQRMTYDIQLEAEIITHSGHKQVISTTSFAHQYWSMDQQLAHHSVNGCKMQTGDLLATGTLSGPEQTSLGCLLEMTSNSQNPLILNNGETRTFLEDGDSLIIRAFCGAGENKISFGEVRGTLCAAL